MELRAEFIIYHKDAIMKLTAVKSGNNPDEIKFYEGLKHLNPNEIILRDIIFYFYNENMPFVKIGETDVYDNHTLSFMEIVTRIVYIVNLDEDNQYKFLGMLIAQELDINKTYDLFISNNKNWLVRIDTDGYVRKRFL